MQYFYNEQFGTCTERCKVKNDGTRIGSAKCKECENCTDYNHSEGYIKCNEIERAVGE